MAGADVLPMTDEPLGEGAASGAPERVHVALVGAPGHRSIDELHRVLVQRLRVFTALLAAPLAVMFVLYLWEVLSASWAGVREGWGDPAVASSALVKIAVPMLISGGSAAILWVCPPASLRALRGIEVLTLGTIAVILLWAMVDPELYWVLEQAAREPDRISRVFVTKYVDSFSFRWFCVILVYGVLIPNTWRRCAAMVGVLALGPPLWFGLWSFWIRPLESHIALSVLLFVGLYTSAAAAVVVFASYRIEVLRQQVSEARKLGQYRLHRRLGAGGMGEVYLAEHVLLRRPCALKLIRPERAGDPTNLRRFEREVQITATLTHPNTVQVFDYGHTEDRTFYYVMEYLPGLTLEELVTRHGPLPPARAIHFLRQVCRALGEAHARGLIHRDIKPSNVIVCERGGIHDVAKLLDFGLVRPSGGLDEKLTQDGDVTGTPDYVSPEQAAGQEDVDARGDIYSVGALAYFLLTGRPPFAGRSGVKVLAAHLYEAPAPLTDCRPDLSADLEAVVLRCLSKQPGGRHADVHALEAALAGCETAAGWSTREAASWWRAAVASGAAP